MVRCPDCNRNQSNSVLTCDCGFDLQAYRIKLDTEQKIQNVAERPYVILPILLTVLRGIGVLSMLGGLIYAFSLYFVQEESGWLAIGAFLIGILASVPYFAISEALTILLHTSEKQDRIMFAIERFEERQMRSK
jgi:hypothetical protein